MSFTMLKPSDLALAAAYFAAAAIMVATTRFDGGVAFLWVATAILVPVLTQRPRGEWAAPLLACGVASVLATGFYGLGWKFAVPLAIANLVEAAVAARFLGSAGSFTGPFESLRSVSRFLFAVGIIAPLCGAAIAGVTVAAAGFPLLVSAKNFFVGHALGAISFIPVVSLLVSGEFAQTIRKFDRRRSIETIMILAVVAATIFAAFWIDGYPLLFLPAGPIIVAIFRGRQIGAAVSIVLFAVIGGVLTMTGHGPIRLIDLPPGGQMQFFQFCLAAYVLAVLPVAADLKHRSQLHRELRLSEERYRMIADQSTDIVMHTGVAGRVQYISPSIFQIGGFSPEEVIGQYPFFMLHPDDHDKIRDEHARTLADRGATRIFDYRGIRRDGETRWFETHSKAIFDRAGRPDGILSLIRDISARKAVEERLAEDASTDLLTGLGNRRAFQREAHRMLADQRSQQVSVALIDLDHFKSINDRFGHDAGDEVLAAFARIARGMLRDNDVLTRVGGEEFAILFPNLGPSGAVKVCDRIRVEIASTPCPTRAGDVTLTISGGVARITDAGLDDAVTRADGALYAAKNEGRDRFHLAD